jgi:SAM-dependent methyltransferase
VTLLNRASQSLRLRLADAADTALRRRDALTPPRRLTGYVGNTDFRATGAEFRGHFESMAGLRADDRVLDIGCGIGRMARILVPVLRPPGSYDGFDIVLEGIDWCRGHYQGTPAPFAFHHADLRNALYNPNGRHTPETYRFPFADASFDLAVATSLFTHVLAATADRYLAEAARVLVPGGRLFTTWLLLDCSGPPEGFVRIGAELPGAVANPAVPEAAVAYEELWLRERLVAHGLELERIDPGSWSGRGALHHQDLVVARKR